MSPDVAQGQSPPAPEPPAVTPALRRRLQQCYEHGTKLMQQESYNHDYAHSILVDSVLNDPGNLVYVEAMLQNLQKKYHNNKRGAWLKGFGGRGPLKKAVAKKDWAEVLKLGPGLLKKNPWDVPVLRSMADACAAYGYQEVELRYLKNALEANPKDAAVNRHCALSLARLGHFDQAIACWTRVDEIKRGDDEAQKMISELQIEKTQFRGRGGGEGHRPTPAKSLPARPAPSEATEEMSKPPDDETPRRREVQLTPRQQLEQEIANRPTDLDAYFSLVKLHLEDDRFGEALHVVHKALAASGNDPKVQERVEEVEVLRKKHQLAVAENRAAADPSEANQQLAEQLRADLHRFEWEVFYRRSERYPQDLEVKYQLALRLKKLEKPREAIPYFEASRGLPRRRADSSLELGECFQRLKQYGKALEHYRQAVEQYGAARSEAKKLALYRAGTLATALQNVELADNYLSELVAWDAAYKDAASRLDKIREIRHKG